MNHLIEATTPITVTLMAAEWNLVINQLGKQPYEVVAPLIQKISEQAQAAAGQGPVINGSADHVRN